MSVKCYIFDIDGTLADCTHRIHHIEKHPKDWDSFFAASHADAPILHMIELYRLCATKYPVICVSGRSDTCRTRTEDWLVEHCGNLPWALYMRKTGDHRDDDIIKAELLAQLRGDGWIPVMVFDDRTRVVNMWREHGIPCLQVAHGDF